MRLNACVEDLDAMTPNETGRFCSSCNKNIVDLTDKSHVEIHQLYLENNGELCGIVLPNQLEERKYYHPLKRFAFALMLVFGSALFVFGGNIKPHFDAFRMRVLTEVTNFDTTFTIKGFVYADGKSITHAEITVVAEDEMYKVRTDANGQFILELPNLKNEEVQLIITAKGFEASYKQVTLSSGSIFVGKITLKVVKIEDCVKGKIAPEVIRTAGVVAMPDPPKPEEIQQTQGEISPIGGGIEPPSDDSLFD